MSLQDRLGQKASTSSGTRELQERLAAAAEHGSHGGSAPVSAMPVSSSVPISGVGGGFNRRSTRKVYDPLAGVRRRAHEALLELLGPQLYDTVENDEELERRVRQALPEVLAKEEQALSAADRGNAYRQILDEILGHGPIEPMLRDPDITEIMVNSWDRIYVERDGQISPVDAAFMDEQHLRRVIDKIVSRVGRRIDESSPMVDARLPDGSRVNAVVPPVAIDGAALTVRKFSADPFTIEDLLRFGTMTPEVADLLHACVQGRLDIVISGGTGTGKTTLLNVISSYLPESERIITIEDSAELRLDQEHVLRMEYRPPNMEGRGEVTIRDLVRNALRMRPDRIVVGEVRDGAALDMLQAMNTGHDGSLTTVHANTPRDSVSRLETMVLMAGMDLPIRAVREQIASAVDLIVQLSRMRDGSRRITSICEVVGMDGDNVKMQDIFAFDFRAGQDQYGRHQGVLRSTGIRPNFLDVLIDHNIPVPPDLFGRDLMGA
ncbi:pilus assembly protein CpaF [Allocatelliglobosispora scoriae]|uniref:Pilus assembly protein CpaF n=1 Tax=Allocatelliglobosispora scoriae TaxID=643052 RepID=A0A841BW39_9ACTN|nr:CpaF family protein [Allocatelliglobosispora scoriae]MBB5870951.1 pilus assembly protein CpaF [Allocatelliglobosispora scoriae]